MVISYILSILYISNAASLVQATMPSVLDYKMFPSGLFFPPKALPFI